MYNYEYFSGANVAIYLNKTHLIECAGLSYSLQNSQQPIYGYGSTVFDAILPGREIVQGNFVINFTKPNYLNSILGNTSDSLNTLVQAPFDIVISFGAELSNNKNSKTIKNCFLISMGQTIQISEQVILEEYSFIGRNIINGVT